MCGVRARRIATSPGTSKGRFSLPGFFLFLFLGFFQRLTQAVPGWNLFGGSFSARLKQVLILALGKSGLDA